MKRYRDVDGWPIEWYEAEEEPPLAARHVLVLAEREGALLVVRHPVRGWEVPGGKCEPGERAEEAAAREVREEAGATIGDMRLLGHYIVRAEPAFCKAVFAARLVEVPEFFQAHETIDAGLWPPPVLLAHPARSFHMRDAGMPLFLERMKWL